MYEKLKRKNLVPSVQKSVQNVVGPVGGQGGVVSMDGVSSVIAVRMRTIFDD